MKNIYEIKEKAILSKKAIFNTKEFSNLIGKSVAISNVYISRLVTNGLAKRKHGRVIFSSDDNVIGTQFIEPSYISLSSALYFHKIINQVPTTTTCITTINSRYYKDMQLKYHKINPKLFFGFKKYKVDLSYAYIADPEKAILDGIYYGIYNKSIFEDYKSKINFKILKKYSKFYPKRIKDVIEGVK
jgi:predicted transcriptional regulator of viral defense system